jgi:triosephosphate isomerase
MDPLRRPIVASNWKMHLTTHEAVTVARRLRAAVTRLDHVDVLVAPPFTVLAAVADVLNGTRVRVAAQTMDARADGAFTGEVSGPMIRDAGATWVLLGHHERRRLFHETDADVAAKLASAVEQGFVPIVCVGDSLEDRQRGDALGAVHRQLDAVLEILSTTPGPITLAYEPVWAMGTGYGASAADVEPMHRAIRTQLARTSAELSIRARILYAGPVTKDDALLFLEDDDVDGVLVGSPGVNLESFITIATLADRLAAGEDSIRPVEENVVL